MKKKLILLATCLAISSSVYCMRSPDNWERDAYNNPALSLEKQITYGVFQQMVATTNRLIMFSGVENVLTSLTDAEKTQIMNNLSCGTLLNLENCKVAQLEIDKKQLLESIDIKRKALHEAKSLLDIEAATADASQLNIIKQHTRLFLIGHKMEAYRKLFGYSGANWEEISIDIKERWCKQAEQDIAGFYKNDILNVDQLRTPHHRAVQEDFMDKRHRPETPKSLVHAYISREQLLPGAAPLAVEDIHPIRTADAIALGFIQEQLSPSHSPTLAATPKNGMHTTPSIGELTNQFHLLQDKVGYLLGMDIKDYHEEQNIMQVIYSLWALHLQHNIALSETLFALRKIKNNTLEDDDIVERNNFLFKQIKQDNMIHDAPCSPTCRNDKLEDSIDECLDTELALF